MAPTDDLTAQIREALQDADVPLWLPDLTPALADAGWHKLGRDLGLTRASYGTVRVLRRDPEETRWLVASFDAPLRSGASDNSIPIELLPADIARQWASPGTRFFGAEEILGDGVSDQVQQALEILGGVETLLETVCSLISAVHVIDPADDEVDVSFSDPDLPFSAFVSVPGGSAGNVALRVAEAMLHEAMHLQLTFIERLVPLIKPTERSYFSPWRNQLRSPQGVLHALYVFRVIDAFFGAIRIGGAASESLRCHALKRRAEITRQIESIRDFRECQSLTDTGAAFLSRMLG